MGDHVVGATASGLVELILDKLGMPSLQEIGRVIGVEEDLERLKDTLSAINAVLLDAEEQQMTLHSVRNWVRNLTDVAYDIEDVLDLISTHDLEQKSPGESLVQKVGRTFRYYSLPRKLKAVSSRLDEIAANKSKYSFQQRQPPLLLPILADRERETSSFVQESHVFGREEDKEWIVACLVSSSSQGMKEIPVLSIVGIGGMGKTTLAKLVVNDPRVVEYFELKLWAYVPNKFDAKAVLHNIMQSATGESCSNLNIEAIKNRLHRILTARTFLLVLDNVCIEDSKAWLELKELLEVGSSGSRILITTREERVAFIVGTMEPYKLKPLSDDHCWSIFVRFAFREGEERAYPSLVQIGKDMVRKCCGVPLAAKTLGSQLGTARDDSAWRRIEESELWKINQEPNDILPALKLSFNQLPYHLRRCFSFCSTSLKGDHLGREVMIWLWMALGLLESKEMNGDLEEIGKSRIDELMSRSFFDRVDHFAEGVRLFSQQCRTSEAAVGMRLSHLTDKARSYDRSHKMRKYVQMHDLMHDLATYVSAEETAFVSYDKLDVSSRVRFLVWKAEEDLSERKFPYQLLTAKKARALLFRTKKSGCMISKSFLQNLFSNFRCLRVISFAGLVFEDLPNSVGDLKHLRFLGLGGNIKLKGLPDSICKLVNLQTLEVYGCVQLERLPRDMHRLLSLRVLLFTSKLTSFPETGLHGWTSIQQMRIYRCTNLSFLPKQIGTLATLQNLQISYCPNLTSLPNSISNLTDLKELQIWGCRNLDLTGWEGLRGLRSLQQLNLQGLPLLVHFPNGLEYISGSLKYLIIKVCPNLIALPECLEHCTSLLRLTLYKCSSLSALPSGIQNAQSLQKLWIDGCPELSPRCERETGEDWHLISHISTIEVDNHFIQEQGFPA